MESFNDDVYTENGPWMILILPDILFVLKSTERKNKKSLLIRTTTTVSLRLHNIMLWSIFCAF